MIRWILPPLISLVLFWPGLTAWFQKDDFVWLGLYRMIHSWTDLWDVLFHPYAQGTVRTISERVFFTAFYALFGMHALPYRMLAFLTHMTNLTLINIVGEKLSGSRAAGFWAAILWTINSSMAIPLAWTAIYYELMCAFVFLMSLWLLMRYAETRERRYLIAQWIIYLLGFGVLELNVVYPAIALVYAWCWARRILRNVYPMFIPAFLYAILHIAAAPLSVSGPYRMHWDLSAFPTLWTYWKIALGPVKLINLGIYPSPGRSALALALTAGLCGFALWKAMRRDWKALFGAAWFVIVLAPLLPLRDHISDYYLTIPLAGFALWGGSALLDAWRSGPTGKAAGAALLAIYFVVNLPLARLNVRTFHDDSQRIHSMIESVVADSRLHPDAPIVLTSISPELFWSAIVQRPFRLYGLDDVHVAAESRAAIEARQPGQDISEFFVSGTR